MYQYNVVPMSLERAAQIAELMNTWAGPMYRREIITAEEVRRMKPIKCKDGYEVFAIQWGDVTIAVRTDTMTCQHLCW